MHSSHVQKSEVLKAQKESCIPEHVTFCDAEDDYYPVGQDVRCSYKILASLEPNSYDWVGLFKAGSSLPSEYVYYEWSPLPKDYVKGTDVMNAVVFPGNRMPTEDGKLYQFSYVSADGRMSGTSKRFLFRLPKSVEILDDAEEQEGELVILRTKTSTLEAKIRETMEENVILKEKLDHMDDASLCLLDTHNQLEQELSRTMEELSRTKEELSRTKQLKSRLQMKIDVADSIREFENQTLKWHAARLEEKVSLINEENKKLKTQLSVADVLIADLKSDVEVLTASRIELMKRVDTVEEENRHFQASTFVSLMAQQRDSCEQMKADFEKLLMEATDTSARTKKLADELKEKLLSQLLENEKQEKILQQERAKFKKHCAEHEASSLSSKKLVDELKDLLQRHLLEREHEMLDAEMVRADLEKQLTEEMASSQSSKKLVDELKEILLMQINEREEEKKAFEKNRAELEKHLSEVRIALFYAEVDTKYKLEEECEKSGLVFSSELTTLKREKVEQLLEEKTKAKEKLLLVEKTKAEEKQLLEEKKKAEEKQLLEERTMLGTREAATD